ncbi:MAG: SusD/RagB family nutrient-binding outer membrane lipoprotein [Chitinophagaceae bacterium]
MKKLFAIILLPAVLLLSSCSKNFLNVNNNPNSPSTVNDGTVLSNALNQMANQYSTNLPQVLGMWLGYWSRSGNYIPDNATETYQISPGYGYSENYWQTLYHVNLDLNYLDQQATLAKDPFFDGIAKVLKAYNYENLVDVYNNIPYSQALDITNLKPVYDDAGKIYTDLFAKLDSGIALLKTAEGSAYTSIVGTDAPYDIMFQGNGSEVVSWIQFANTVKLRMLLNLSQDASMSTLVQSQLAEIAAEGDGFITAGNSAMVNPGYSNSQGKQSPFYGTFGLTPTGNPTGNNIYFRANKYAVNFYTNTNDPRISQFFAPTTSAVNQSNTDTISGNYEGDPTALGNSNTSAFGPGLIGTATSSTPILSDFESLFLQAEAAQRGWIPGNAQNLYQAAITQSFIYEGVPNATSAAQTYYNQLGMVNVNWASSPNKIQAIIVQKWAALNGVDIQEAWNDYRRLGLPSDLPISSNPHVTTRQIPVRLLYPQTEQDRNPTNVPQLGANAQFTSNIFWMP